MDQDREKEIRDLKLKIAKFEKELTQSQHTMGLQGWLKTGHAGQLSRNAEKDRKRIEEKLRDLRTQLDTLENSAHSHEKAAPKKDAAKKKL